MDIVASLYNRNNLSAIVRRTTDDVFIPITVGGGLRSVDDVRSILQMGADKAAINTAAIKDESIITQVAEAFGSQCMVLGIEAKKRRDGPGVHPAGRCGVRLRQRLDGLHRRRPVRVRRRGRHFDPETPRPRPDGAARTHDLQIRDFRQRTDQRAMTVTPPPAATSAAKVSNR